MVVADGHGVESKTNEMPVHGTHICAIGAQGKLEQF